MFLFFRKPRGSSIWSLKQREHRSAQCQELDVIGGVWVTHPIIHGLSKQSTTSWHLAQTKKIFIAKTIKFRSYLKICRGVMKENSSKNFFDPAENRNFDFPNRSLCSKTFTNCILTQILLFLLNFCTFTVIVLSSAVMAKCIKWF